MFYNLIKKNKNFIFILFICIASLQNINPLPNYHSLIKTTLIKSESLK